MKRKTTLAILASLFSSLSFSVVQAADINEKPVEGKEYNEPVYYDNNGTENFSLKFNSPGEHNFHFNEGATLDASKGTSWSAIYGSHGQTINYTIGSGKDFTIKHYDGSDIVSEGASFSINGGNIVLEAGLTASTAASIEKNNKPDRDGYNTRSAIHMEEGGNLTIDSDSLWIGNKRTNRQNVGAISVVALMEGKGDSNVTITNKTTFTAEKVASGILVNAENGQKATVSLSAGEDITIWTERGDGKDAVGYRGAGVYNMTAGDSTGSKSAISIQSINGNIAIASQGYGLMSYGSALTEMIADNGDITINSRENSGVSVHGSDNTVNQTTLTANGNIKIDAQSFGLYSKGNVQAKMTAQNGDITISNREKSGVSVQGSDNTVNQTTLTASDNITIDAQGNGLSSGGKGEIQAELTAKNGDIMIHSKNGNALDLGGKDTVGSNIITLWAFREIDLRGNDKYGIRTNDTELYTESGGLKVFGSNKAVSFDGGVAADFKAEKATFTNDISVNQSKMTVSANDTAVNGQVEALKGSAVTFDSRQGDGTGKAVITRKGADAVYAESDTADPTKVIFKQAAVIQAQEDELYHADTQGTALHAMGNAEITLDKAAAVYGDMIADKGSSDTADAATASADSLKGGKIAVTSLEDAVLKGNALAVNTGEVALTLNHAAYEGQIDDYAGKDVIARTREFKKPVTEGGTVNLTLNNSAWTAHGQNFVTNVQFGQQGSVIDLSQGTGSQSVTMQKLSGSGTFNMRLNSADHASGDMLYIGRNTGHQTINIVGGITGGLDNISKENPLRFATVGIDEDSLPDVKNSGIRAFTRDAGVWDLEYIVAKETFNKDDTENEAYNGKGNGEGTDKPGNDFVENVLVGDNDKAVNWIITGVKKPDETPDPGTPDNPSDSKGPDTPDNPNPPKTRVSDAGKTILAMSKVNYSNAVYMDRLNKRMGEARYIDGDEGLWVRMRHDRIGKSDAFRSKNTMMELGYDKKVGDRDDGEHRQGIVFDYMRGTASYDNVAGDGDVRRGGVWLYDTWLGDKGHYTDYVLKFGRLSNDFEVYARSTGEKITGDYSNFVYSASAEYGRKKDLGNNWYIEPQAQLQYAHVTDADYTTSQGTDVDLDAIDSLIGRVGFRLGKDVGENNTFYIKADILHEFLGDQDIKAHDVTGRLSTTYENKGTWYDVGLGFSHQFGQGTYMFFDVEKTFGHDNEDTYQLNMGMNWKV